MSSTELSETVGIDRERDAEFDRAFELLDDLIDWPVADEEFPVRGNAVYTTSVVLWMLVSQRLNPERSLESAVKRLLESQPDFLPRNKRVVEAKLSSGTGSYSRARDRLPRAGAEWLAQQVSQRLISASAPSFGNRRVYLVDGTTLTLAPERSLRRAFPAASNQHGPGVWPMALLVVAHELASGAALVPAVGAMYGEQAVSETALVDSLFTQMPADGIVMADAGYGIYSVAWKAQQTGRDFVFRMTSQRFGALIRKARIVYRDNKSTTYSLAWRPSDSDRKSHPDLPQEAVLQVRLHEIHVHKALTLKLVTSLREPATELAELYRCRTNIETDLKSMKVVLNTETIRARSVEMFHKELLTSMVAYNLVTQFRREAAELAKLPPRRLSFKRVWTTFRIFLWEAPPTDALGWYERYRRALGYATKDKLPNRPGRSYEREAYHRQPKSSHFKKRKPKDSGSSPNP